MLIDHHQDDQGHPAYHRTSKNQVRIDEPSGNGGATSTRAGKTRKGSKNIPMAAGPHHRIMESTQSSISRIQPANGYRICGLGSVRSSAKLSSHQSGPDDTRRSSLKRMDGPSGGSTPSKQARRSGSKRKGSKRSSSGQKQQPYTSLRRRSSPGQVDHAAKEQRMKIEMIKKKYSRQ